MEIKGKKKQNEYDKIMKAKTPHDLLTIYFECKYLNQWEKAQISKEWKAKYKFTREDIKRARDKHPLWLARKKEGVDKEKSKERFKKHNYNNGDSKSFTQDELMRLYDMDIAPGIKPENKMKDWELAKEFKASLSLIITYRRRFKLITQVIENAGAKITKNNVIKMLPLSIFVLQRMEKGEGFKKKDGLLMAEKYKKLINKNGVKSFEKYYLELEKEKFPDYLLRSARTKWVRGSEYSRKDFQYIGKTKQKRA